MYQRTLDIRKYGHSVTIWWISSHVGLVEPDSANLMARNKARRGRKAVEQWSWITYIKKKLTESRSQELTKWHEAEVQERGAIRRGFYIPRL